MQTELFGTHPNSAKKPPMWEGLKPDDRAAVIQALARLMATVIRPGSRRKSDER